MGTGRMNLDWVVGWWSEAQVNSVGTTELSLVGLPELDVYEHDLIVERVVGQYYLQSSATTSVTLFHTRLYTCETNGAGVATPISLNLFDDAQQQFMWHKVQVLDMAPNFGSRNMGPPHHPEWSHLDVKVNRKLGDLEELRFHIEPQVETVAYAWGAWIRVLVKH